MLSIIPPETVQPAVYFLEPLNTPAAHTAIRLALAALCLGLGGLYLHTRRLSEKPEAVKER